MANKLSRSGYFFVLPSVAYQPARPAYTSIETYTVTTPTLTTTPAPGWGRRIVKRTDPQTGLDVYIEEYVWLGNGAAPSGQTSTTTGGYTTTTISEVTVHPATPEMPGSPARRVDDPPRGWTAFAHSLASIASSGDATFKVRANVTGVAIGLSAVTAPSAGYSHIRHGLLLDSGSVRNLRTGANLGTFTTADVFRMVLRPAGVTFLRNGGQIGTDSNTYVNGEPLFLSAAMFGNGDEVNSPTLVDYGSGTSLATMAVVVASSAEAVHAESQGIMRALTVNSGEIRRSLAMLGALAAFSSDRVGGSSLASLPAAKAQSYGGALIVSPQNDSYAQLPGLQAASLLLVGATGSSSAVMAPLWARSADHPYGESSATMQPLTALSYVIDPSMAYMLDGMRFDVVLAADKLEVVQLRDVLVLAVDMTIERVDSVRVLEGLVLGVVMTTTEVDLVSMSLRIVLGVAMTLPGEQLEVHAVNLDGYGSTLYSNYPFTSFARIGDRYYGAKLDGLFLLDGPDDVGAPIHALIGLGERDFGNTQEKAVSEAYLGMASDGHLLLTVAAHGCAYQYRTRSQSGHMREQRITLGKGLRANYVTLQLENEDGCDFQIDSLQFNVVDMQRNI